ncbi:MAG: C39 family peptidase [Candidatus Peregrinibacteria bacterium]
MLRSRLVIIGLTMLTLGSLLSSCTRKPTFSPPDVIVTNPQKTASSSAHSSITQKPSSVPAAAPAPASLLITVPFAPQAPFAKWDALHEEACEEMSLIMVHHFLEGTPLPLQTAEDELQLMITWERANGFADDITATELGSVAQSLFGYRSRILTEITAEALRRELRAGNPIIIPAAGRLLGNPFFSGDGPWYHMLVVTGFNKDGFITNDPGTKRGESFWYSTDVLMNAIHDWNVSKEKISEGPKKAIVIER